MPINMEAPMASTSILSFSAQGVRGAWLKVWFRLSNRFFWKRRHTPETLDPNTDSDTRVHKCRLSPHLVQLKASYGGFPTKNAKKSHWNWVVQWPFSDILTNHATIKPRIKREDYMLQRTTSTILKSYLQ